MKSLVVLGIIAMAAPAFAQQAPAPIAGQVGKTDFSKPVIIDAPVSRPLPPDRAFPIEVRPATSAEPLATIVSRPVNDCPAADDTSVTMSATCVAKLKKN